MHKMHNLFSLLFTCLCLVIAAPMTGNPVASTQQDPLTASHSTMCSIINWSTMYRPISLWRLMDCSWD